MNGEITGTLNFILKSLKQEEKALKFPCDYRVYSTNPLSIAYGACGTLLFVRKVLGRIPDDYLKWVQVALSDLRDYPPGLFVGLAGIAWFAGDEGIFDKAFSSGLLFKSPDIFYGSSGVGLTSLHFYSVTKNDSYLKRARL